MNASKTGDYAEYKAVAWLMAQGYEVFHNASCVGPVDIIALDVESGETLFIDVKVCSVYIKKDGTKSFGSTSLSPTQQNLNVKHLFYEKDEDRFFWAESDDPT